jgi:uncharacterized protein
METPERLAGGGRRVRVYFGESDRFEGRPLWSALLEHLRRHGAAGATVLRGVASFGAQSLAQGATVANVANLSVDVPLVLEWIDSERRVAQILPELVLMLDGGLVTTEPVEIVRYAAHESQGRH